ncbi:MAG: sensor histidine kinase, partial [Thermoplasmata archaeon]
IEIECRMTEEPRLCELDEKLFSQALLNLVINAQEAMPDGGTLSLSTARSDDAVTVSVGDTGLGIPPEMQDRVFRPFFSTKATGTGLGLSFVQRIVDEHGGRIHLHSEPGKGTTFTLWLPTEPIAKA